MPPPSTKTPPLPPPDPRDRACVAREEARRLLANVADSERSMVLEHLLAAVRLSAAELTDVRRLLETYHGRLSDLMGRVEPILHDHHAEVQARQAARLAQEAEILAHTAGEETRIKRAQKIAQAEKDLKAAKFRATAWRLGELLLAAGVSAVATWLGLARE